MLYTPKTHRMMKTTISEVMNINGKNIILGLSLTTTLIVGSACSKNTDSSAGNELGTSTNEVSVEAVTSSTPAPALNQAAPSIQTMAESAQKPGILPVPPMPAGNSRPVGDLSSVQQSVAETTSNLVSQAKKAMEEIHVDATQAATLMVENPDVVVLDLRTAGEVAKGMIPAAINIDFRASEFSDNLKKLSRDKKYLIHCQSGGRSTQALTVFKSLGFEKIYHLDGGYSGWEKAGLETSQP